MFSLFIGKIFPNTFPKNRVSQKVFLFDFFLKQRYNDSIFIFLLFSSLKLVRSGSQECA